MLTTDHLLILPCIWRWSPEWFHSSPHLVFEMRLRGLLFPELLIPKIGATLIFFQFSGVSPVHLSGPRNFCVCVQVIPVLPNLINLHWEQIFLTSDFSSGIPEVWYFQQNWDKRRHQLPQPFSCPLSPCPPPHPPGLSLAVYVFVEFLLLPFISIYLARLTSRWALLSLHAQTLTLLLLTEQAAKTESRRHLVP